MNRTEIEQSILNFLRGDLGVDVQCADTDLIETGILDSGMVVDLVLYMEEQFQVTAALEDLDIENFATVARMTRFIGARKPATGQRAAGPGGCEMD